MVDFILEKEFINPPDVQQQGKTNKSSTDNVSAGHQQYHLLKLAH